MAGGFGGFGCGAGPCGPLDPPPAPPTTTLVASWAIDPETQRYQLDAAGNPLGMNGTAQRVYLAVCAVDVVPDIITPQGKNSVAAAFRTALRGLVAEGAITKLSVSVTDDGGARLLKTISYQDAGTNLPVTLKIR